MHSMWEGYCSYFVSFLPSLLQLYANVGTIMQISYYTPTLPVSYNTFMWYQRYYSFCFKNYLCMNCFDTSTKIIMSNIFEHKFCFVGRANRTTKVSMISQITGDCCVNGSVAEWSKALVLGTSHFDGVGSNPTAAKFFLQFFIFFFFSCRPVSCYINPGTY